MTPSYAQYWADLPEKAKHPRRVPILEALWYVGEPLSAIGLVNLFDGQGITMWSAVRDLRALEDLGVVKAYPAGIDPRAKQPTFDLPYRLAISAGGGAKA